MEIRRGRIDDLDALCALEASSFNGDRLSRRSLRHHLRSACAELWLALDPTGQLLGYSLMLFRCGTGVGRIYSIAVAAPARGRGVAKALLAAIDRQACGRGMRELRLEVRPDNLAALQLYEAHGYQRFGICPRYYEDGADGLRLRKMLEMHISHGPGTSVNQ